MGDETVRRGWYGAVPLAHQILSCRIREGDRVVDATCGNGNDTLFLARLVGPSGHVFAFDVQQKALERTRSQLEQESLGERVTLVAVGHERMGEYVRTPVRGIVFNLGYLPGGDRNVTTRPFTTRAGIDAGLLLLLPEGIMTVAVYSGHDGGEEGEDILRHCSSLDPRIWNVWVCRQGNRSTRAPFLVVIERQSEEGS